MKIDVDLVEFGEKEMLRGLLREYLIEIHHGGTGDYPRLDSYWEKSDRFPYFIKADGKIDGFALVNSHTLIATGGKNLAEFYIKPEFRGVGIAKKAAFLIWDLFPGKWEGRQIKENTNAHSFWLKVKGEYTNNKFDEVYMDNEQWSGWIQTFDSSLSDKSA